MLLFAGLGNPGRRYSATRHNAGFMVLDALCGRYHRGAWVKKFSADTASVTLGGHRVLLLKPATYMNRSGRSVGAAARFFKIRPERILVIQDDIDLPFGRVRIVQNGSGAGHRGVKDIQTCCGREIWRMKLGVGRPADGATEVEDWVLQAFSKSEKTVFQTLSALIAAEIVWLLDESGINTDSAARFSNRLALLRQ